jgi:soluble lytic murein transglycosylase-like protein
MKTGRAALFLLLAVLLAVPFAVLGQVRIERDAQGHITITNKGSKEAREGVSSNSRPSPAVPTRERLEIQGKLRRACRQKGLDYQLVSALVEAESGYRPNVLSKKGAIGLMQLMPDTAKRFGCRDPWNLDQNIIGGTAYLAYLQKVFNHNTPLVLAAYNAGENAVQKYLNHIPPYAETVRYVFRILDDYGRPSVFREAKALLTHPGDFEKYYVETKGVRPTYHVYYMYVDAKGVRHIYDYPPSGVVTQKIIYKEE